MDPGRREMLAKQRPWNRKSATGPQHDAKTRVSKPSQRGAQGDSSRYLSQDQLARKFVDEEDDFVLKQSKKKADIRVREGRATPHDHLVFNLRYIDRERHLFDDQDEDYGIELKAPGSVISELDLGQLRELQAGVESFLALEKEAVARAYWSAVQVLCEDQLSRLDASNSEERRILEVVADDIDKILKAKKYEELEKLEKDIKSQLESDELIDADFWQQMLRETKARRSKMTLQRIFETIVEEQAKAAKLRPAKGAQDSKAAAAMDVDATAEGLASGPADEDVSQATRALYDRLASQAMLENEEIFTAEEAVPSVAKRQWTEEYTARKPRYFNRVQMGYEWNKYNQTHYDHSNPPPRVVQGYKFNIFYPDLIDNTKTPTFKIIREHGRRRGESLAAAGEADTCLIHFIAGPPYADIAFRIVDREWDFSAKRDRGYKSTFENGVLQLHFQFKKIFYRK
ncbi:hypothetical protein CDD81_127 [Ophiocordyceps australis]|uniref:Splicing factor Cactin n=1 Tax=Ophiocordyceps australis TaxID=1399860 RepID=A0A2C5YIP0_9HYPO|nr:hypothetical protein CDD81_127 [Ophiocordyceps australis]